MSDSRIAMTEGAAARVAGVSERQLRYWEEKLLVQPGIRRDISARNKVRLYRFEELVEVLVAAQLRADFSLQEVRRVVEHLRGRGYSNPLRQLVFAKAGGEIIFQHDNGDWEGAHRQDQVILHHVLDLEVIRARIRNAAEHGRDPALAGQIERRRGVLGGKPVFAGTRVPVAAVTAYLERGRSTADILEAFPLLTEADVQSAVG